MIRAVVCLLLLAACASQEWQATPPPKPPFDGCLPPPPDLPPIATAAQVRAQLDTYEKRLYPDCALRARRNAESHRFYIR